MRAGADFSTTPITTSAGVVEFVREFGDFKEVRSLTTSGTVIGLTHMTIKTAIQISITITAGLVGFVGGAFLGLAFASLITGRGGLHGFDTSAIVSLIGGGLGGIVAGTKLGNRFARRL